ncbi:mating pheromone precursor [Trichoderma barbatum]
MKFLTAVTLLTSVVVAAPNPEPWCYRIGMPCWKVKRTTEAYVDAVRSTGALNTRSEHEGIPNDVALSAIQGLDQLSSLILYASEDPDAFLNNGTEITETEKRDTESQEDKRWCYRIGMPCWKAKRDLESLQEGERSVEVEEEKRWCYRIGMPCWKAKRADEIQEDKRWCYRIGMPCWKSKRVAEAVLGATIQGDEKRSVEAEVPADKRWCYRIGMPCWKAKRDLETIQDLARSVIEDME